MDMLAMQLVRTYGAEVLDSPEFRKAKEQKHHHVTTVGDHSLGVAYVSVKICRFLNAMHIKTDTESIVRGALCHDLGIVGRYEKFSNNLVCWQKHPKDLWSMRSTPETDIFSIIRSMRSISASSPGIIRVCRQVSSPRIC